VPSLGRIRRPGGGRRKILDHDPRLLGALDRLIDPETPGDPESRLRWICKKHADPGRAIDRRKHPVSHMKVAQLLREQGYSLQGNRKTEEGATIPTATRQFRHINTQVKRALAKGVPVISVDTKKKELVGNYENGGRQWLPAKQAGQGERP